jgi:DNA polymerase-3 subunit epsilon
MTYVSPGGSTVDEPELLSRTALKAQRLKPAPGQKPAKRVWSQRRREYIELYDPRQCVAMRERRAPSPAQLAALEAGRRTLTHAACTGCGESVELYLLDQQRVCPDCAGMRWEATQRARENARVSALQALVARAAPSRTLYLDTETTGLSCYNGDEVVELAVIDDAGEVLLESLVKPARCQAWPDAQAIHGISPADVAGAPDLEQLVPQLQALLEEADTLVIYNAAFDLAFLPEVLQPLASSKALCAMQAFALHIGDWDERRESFRWYTLTEAARLAGHQWDGDTHRARADAMAARSVWQWLRQMPT